MYEEVFQEVLNQYLKKCFVSHASSPKPGNTKIKGIYLLQEKFFSRVIQIINKTNCQNCKHIWDMFKSKYLSASSKHYGPFKKQEAHCYYILTQHTWQKFIKEKDCFSQAFNEHRSKLTSQNHKKNQS